MNELNCYINSDLLEFTLEIISGLFHTIISRKVRTFVRFVMRMSADFLDEANILQLTSMETDKKINGKGKNFLSR